MAREKREEEGTRAPKSNRWTEKRRRMVASTLNLLILFLAREYGTHKAARTRFWPWLFAEREEAERVARERREEEGFRAPKSNRWTEKRRQMVTSNLKRQRVLS